MLRKGLIPPFILTSISAILLSLSMPKAGPNLNMLEWFALVPWLLAIRGRRPLYTFLISLWMGIFFWGITIYWLHLVTGLGLFLLLPYLGLYFAVFGWVMGYIINILFLLMVGPLLWMLIEFLRGFLFGGFPWLNLAHGQYLNIPILQWASCGGEGIISGIIILVNLLIMAIFVSGRKKGMRLTVILFLILAFVHLGGKILLKREACKKDTLKAAVIQPNIVEKWDEKSAENKFDILMELSCEALEERPQFIIWPETSFSFDIEKDKFYLEKLKTLCREHNCYLLVGSIKEIGREAFYNRAALVSPHGEITSYDKVKLVPFGEYVPAGDKWPWWKRWVEKIAGYSFSFIAGKKENVLYIDSVPFGVLICFEDIFPGLSRKFKERGARFLVNITDDRWFGRTQAPYQHLAASVIRAAENRIPVIRSANTGISAFIDSSGRITGMVKKEGRVIFIKGFSVEELYF